MGWKNFLLLGFLTENILHNIRNFFNKKEVRLPKRNYLKIKKKHSEVIYYIEDKNKFNVLMSSVLFSYEYKSKEKIVKNMISYIEKDNIFILFSLENTQNHIICKTIFILSKKRVLSKLKYKEKNNFIFLKKEEKIMQYLK